MPVATSHRVAAQEHAQAQQALELLKEHPNMRWSAAVLPLGPMAKQWPAAIAQFANVPAKNDWRDDALIARHGATAADNKLKAIPFLACKELLAVW